MNNKLQCDICNEFYNEEDIINSNGYLICINCIEGNRININIDSSEPLQNEQSLSNQP